MMFYVCAVSTTSYHKRHEDAQESFVFLQSIFTPFDTSATVYLSVYYDR